ncbi:MAG: NAD(P)-dependent oxidoreductase [Christensenellales bacterium]|jgi:3-hydroxyisobutyrate dehydrogenase-like beta-hydroxyacid dehydrogenase
MRIGFIGLGLMGSAMCENLVKKSGCPVTCFDVNPAAMEPLTALGAAPAASAGEVGERCGVIFTMVPKSEHVLAVYEQLLPAARPGAVLVDMSTISPAVSRDLARRAAQAGAVMLDAPVVKSRPAALAGELGIYVGGDAAAYERVRPLLALMGSNIIHLGGNGNGLVMKLCHNALVAQIQNGVNEAMTLAARAAGVDPRAFAKAISYGGGQNFYLDSKRETLAQGDYTTAFSVENMDKDVHLAQELCRQAGLDLAGVRLSCARYEQAMARGLAKEDFSATFKLF